MLSPDEVRAYYDRTGRFQDLQLYENPALDALVRFGDFGHARSVYELGCGTGRLAARLLRDALPPDATYVGVDLSPRMVEHARSRLDRWPRRAHVRGVGPGVRVDAPDAAFDRFVSTYVLDLLPDRDIDTALAEAHRVLARDGLLCLASLTWGNGPLSGLVSRAWNGLFRRHPAWVGGCRPITLLPRLHPGRWTPVHAGVVTRIGVSSEVVVARRMGPTPSSPPR